MFRGTPGEMWVQPDYPFQEHRGFENPTVPAIDCVENQSGGAPTNWSVANESGIQTMLRSAGFTCIDPMWNLEIFICEAPGQIGPSVRRRCSRA